MAALSGWFGFCAMGRVGSRWKETRAAVRTLVVASGVVYFRDTRHVGLVRDISREGLFVYSDFHPHVGDSLRVVINGRSDSADEPVTCMGTVVRVEAKASGAAIGIAMKITEYHV